MIGGFLYLELDISIDEYIDDFHIALSRSIRNDITKPLFVKVKYNTGLAHGDVFTYVPITRVELNGEVSYRSSLVAVTGLPYNIIFHDDRIQLAEVEE